MSTRTAARLLEENGLAGRHTSCARADSPQEWEHRHSACLSSRCKLLCERSEGDAPASPRCCTVPSCQFSPTDPLCHTRARPWSAAGLPKGQSHLRSFFTRFRRSYLAHFSPRFFPFFHRLDEAGPTGRKPEPRAKRQPATEGRCQNPVGFCEVSDRRQRRRRCASASPPRPSGAYPPLAARSAPLYRHHRREDGGGGGESISPLCPLPPCRMFFLMASKS